MHDSLLAWSCAQCSLSVFFISIGSIAMPLLLFHYGNLCLLSFLLLIGLAWSLKFLLIPSRNELFISMIFSYHCPFSISLISALIIIFFLLLTLELICPSFFWFLNLRTQAIHLDLTPLLSLDLTPFLS